MQCCGQINRSRPRPRGYITRGQQGADSSAQAEVACRGSCGRLAMASPPPCLGLWPAVQRRCAVVHGARCSDQKHRCPQWAMRTKDSAWRLAFFDQIITARHHLHSLVSCQSAACPVLLDLLTNCDGPGRASPPILGTADKTVAWGPPAACVNWVLASHPRSPRHHQLSPRAQQSQGGTQ